MEPNLPKTGIVLKISAEIDFVFAISIIELLNVRWISFEKKNFFIFGTKIAHNRYLLSKFLKIDSKFEIGIFELVKALFIEGGVQ